MLFGLEDLCALLEEIVARQQDLSTVIAGVRVVAALFDDGEDGVDGDAIAAAAQGFGDIVTEAEAELLRPRGAQIAGQSLLLGGGRHGLPTLIGCGLGTAGRRGFWWLWPPRSSCDCQLKFVGRRGCFANTLVYVD